ncbi:TauD/TfdA family dioxygenase [uncultured Ruegeria sp.]|uniref:TauD/TfdA family dioxygenase n=1 Tax=uncultured Ruegeria sp. TaxID=259304 RepID=UPI0034508856
MLRHTDSMFLPTPALINILTAKAVLPSGNPTELASTLAAWADLPDQLKIH